MITTLFSESLSYALGWTVIHSLWQSTLLALVIGVLTALIKPQSALARYRLYSLGVISTFIWAAATFIRLFNFHTTSIEVSGLVAGNDFTSEFANNVGTNAALSIATFINYFDTHLPVIITLWLLGMSFFLLRFLGGLAYTQHLRTSRIYKVEEHFVEKINQLHQQLGMQRVVHLFESANVKAPMTLGTFKPIILMPIGALTLLSPAQVEAILAHELAHIRRNDYLFNILQSIVEVLFYFNPAIWWLSAQVRLERENCCDDIAIQLCGDDLAYAKALLSLQEYSKDAPGLALAFSNKRNHLLNRVKRIFALRGFRAAARCVGVLDPQKKRGGVAA
ncbi:MAG: M56 family metallopeptidase, partial [Bacteroidota bacterium]